MVTYTYKYSSYSLSNIRDLQKDGSFHAYLFLKVMQREYAMKPAKMEKYYENACIETEFKIAPIARAHECLFFVAPSLKISIHLLRERQRCEWENFDDFGGVL